MFASRLNEPFVSCLLEYLASLVLGEGFPVMGPQPHWQQHLQVPLSPHLHHSTSFSCASQG